MRPQIITCVASRGEAEAVDTPEADGKDDASGFDGETEDDIEVYPHRYRPNGRPGYSACFTNRPPSTMAGMRVPSPRNTDRSR